MKACLGFALMFAASVLPLEGRREEEPFDALGVCDLVGKEPACWDLKGRPKPELLAEMRRRLEDWTFGVRFQYGRKNRYVVARTPLWMTYRFDPSSRADSVLTLGGGKGRESWNLLRIAAPLDATEPWTVRATVWLSVEPPSEVALRKGVVANVDGDRVEIGNVAVAGPQDGFGYMIASGNGLSPAWRLDVGHAKGSALGTGLRVEPLDRRGREIRYVDAWGRVVDPVKGEQTLARAGIDPWRPPPLQAATFQQNLESTPLGIATYLTNIDPRDIARLRVWRVEVRDRSYGPFPLDPSVP